MERWNARDRICGREIEIGFDPKAGTIAAPEVCPSCGAHVNGVDVLRPVGKRGQNAPAAAPIETPGVGGSTIVRAFTTDALKLAAANGIGLDAITGTGFEGAITKADVAEEIRRRAELERSKQA